MWSFLESLMAYFVQFFRGFAKFLFLKGEAGEGEAFF